MSILLKNGRILQTPITPLQLPNLKLYLSADRMYQYADGTAISSFLDYSGNNYNATQGSGTLQPTFETNEFGINAGIKFDGSNDAMNITGGALDIFRNINQFTVQIVCKRGSLNDLTLPLYALNYANTSVKVSFGLRNDGVAQIIIKNWADSFNQLLLWPSNDLNTHFIQFTLNPVNNTVYAYQDGVLIGTLIIESGFMPNTPSAAINIGSFVSLSPPVYGNGYTNGISINQAYSAPTTIQAQYRGYLQRGYL